MKIENQKAINESFSTVISMVENGWTISKALTRLKISSNTFYRGITKEQKHLLDTARALRTKYAYRYKDLN